MSRGKHGNHVNPGNQKVTTLELFRVLRVMNRLDPNRKGINPKEISRGMYVPAKQAEMWVARRLEYLVKRGWVEKVSRGKYRITNMPEEELR